MQTPATASFARVCDGARRMSNEINTHRGESFDEKLTAAMAEYACRGGMATLAVVARCQIDALN